MVEAILIGIVIFLAALILLIILISGIKGLKKNKKVEVKITEEDRQKIKEEIFVKEALMELNESPLTQVDEVIEVKEEIKLTLNQGEGVVIGSENVVPAGEYIIESTTGEEKFKVRISRYVKEYSNGDKIILEDRQKFTSLTTSIVLK